MFLIVFLSILLLYICNMIIDNRLLITNKELNALKKTRDIRFSDISLYNTLIKNIKRHGKK
jgi:hypothetical protein